jgi:Protein of unknown function (DUF3995)
MQITNVHTRELPVPATRLGALLDGLGAPGDVLWPSERWPATPLRLDGPLTPGTRSRQGLLPASQIRQVVDEVLAGRRVSFRFEPGIGLHGGHRLEVEPIAADRSRMRHTLECRLDSRMLPVYPLLMAQHNALVEDLLDRAELASTGALERPARMPAFVRVANAVEEAVARRRGLLPALPPPGPVTGRGAHAAGVAVPAVLAGLALLHAAWALGWYLPAGDERELAKLVLGESERELLDGSMPPDAASWAVAGALAGAAALVHGTARGRLPRRLRGLTWGVAAVFLLRGTAMVPFELAGGPADAYERLDLAFYSPLCLGLAAGTAAVLRDARRGAAVEARTTSSAGRTTRRLRRPAMLA